VSRPRQTQPGAAFGIFGGTFDPVHFGHLRAALEGLEKLGLRELKMIPAGDPPHRAKPVGSAADRLAMLRLAVASCPGLSVDDRETRRAGPSYMVDTLEQLREEAGERSILLLVGQDAANALDTWHRWRELFELAHLVIMRRPDAHFSCTGELARQFERRRVAAPGPLMESPAGQVLPLEITQLDISSTLIRHLLGAGKSPRFLTPDPVVAFIEDRGLYTAGPKA
jgi:nicotinate-nucleotide adenylyltransferase